jgi:hypothetical protein
MKNTLTILILATLVMSSTNAHAISDSNKEYESLFFDTNSELFYRIGGANRIRPPLTPDANVVS